MMAAAESSSLYESVMAEQEKFAALQEQLAQERRTLQNQLQKVHLSRDSGMSGSGSYLDEHSTNYRQWNQAGAGAIPEDQYENDATIPIVDPVLVNRKVDTKVDKKVYRSERIQRRVIGDPGYCSEGTFYQQDEAPIHESRYTTTTRSNDGNLSGDGPEQMNGSKEPNLVSRNTSSTTTQEVTTVTRVYRTYERVPNETLLGDYDYPEEFLESTDALYAKPHRNYASQLNGHVNGHHQPNTPPNRPSSSLHPDDVGYAAYSTLSRRNNMDGYSGSPTATAPNSEAAATKYRDPDLAEVIEFLRNPSNVIKANAAAHLAHLAYMNDQVKLQTRHLNAIPILLDMLNSAVPEMQRNACGALRNIAFGRGNDENKRAIRGAGGVGLLVKLLRHCQESDIGELVTAVLWILSSCDDLKKPILEEACPLLIRQILLPHSELKQPPSRDRRLPAYTSTVFRNSSGVLRNVSSAGFVGRRTLRESEDVIAALLHLLRSAVHSQDIDNKSIENVVCSLRNLSFRCQEVEDPDYDKKRPTTAGKKDKDKGKGGSVSAPGSLNGTPAKSTPYAHLKSLELLWSVENIKCYLAVLSNCANPDTLEAAAGIIQNLSACFWQPAVDVRAAVRKEKGLPILVELLCMDDDRVVCSVVRAMRNLAVDQRNRELIGKYAMRELAGKVPNGVDSSEIVAVSDETIAAVLATVNQVVRKHQEFARSFLDVGGVERLVHISQNYNQYSSKVVRFSFLVLQTLWAHSGLHDVYRASGWKESHFLSKPPNINTKTLTGSDTLARTFSSQGPTKFEDKTLPRGAIPPEEEAGIALNMLPSSKTKGGSRRSEPVYAQVNRAEKQKEKERKGEAELGGDSWV